MSGGLFDKTTQSLALATNMRKLRQELISTNIANAETPGFKAKKLEFEDTLARAVDLDGARGLSGSDPAHIAVGGGDLSTVKPDIFDNPEGTTNPDGNTVDMEKEMAALAENTVLYKAAIQLMNKKMAALRYAATEGR